MAKSLLFLWNTEECNASAKKHWRKNYFQGRGGLESEDDIEMANWTGMIIGQLRAPDSCNSVSPTGMVNYRALEVLAMRDREYMIKTVLTGLKR